MRKPPEADKSSINDNNLQVEDDELEAFVNGMKSRGDAAKLAGPAKYLNKWKDLQEGTSKWAGFNFSSFFFGTVWSFYRKMYVPGILLLLTEFIGAFIAAIVIFVAFGERGFDESHAVYISISLLIVIRIIFGLLANKLYFNRARKLILKTKKMANKDNLLGEIRAKGGVSGTGLVIGVLIYMAIKVLENFPIA